MNKKLNILLITFLLLLTKLASAQTYPVTSNVVLVPPYSLNIPDYYAPGSNNLQVTLLLNDLNVISYDVKLRLVIRSSNAIIATSQGFKPAIPITLQGGVPTTLSGSELSEYLDYNNLIFQGITRSQLSQNGGKLPEGVYQFNVEVYDYNLDVRVSNSPRVAAWMLLNDPPILNTPANNSKPKALDPQNLLFQWTPRHLASPNSAFTTNYNFKLVEVWPSTTNPNQAILSGTPIYTTTTNATSLVYGAAETTLVPGRTYAWQVQATEQNNLDLFKNQGFSEVFSFTYGDECVAPTNLSAQILNSQKIQVDWNGQWNHSKTQVEIKKHNSPNSPWTSFEAFNNQQVINQLAKGTTFEYRVRGYCGTITSPYIYDTISTPQQSANDFSCGPPVPDTSQTVNTPLVALNPTDQFTAYDYTINVTEATKNPDGTFTGKGIVKIPAFEQLKFNVQFNNITLNTNYKLIAGNVITIYDEANSLFVDLDRLIETLGGYNGKVKNIDINYPVDSIQTITDSNGNVTGVVVHGEGGQTTTYTGGINYNFSDSEGNIYKVSEGGETIQSSGTKTNPITQNNTQGGGTSNAGEDGIPITTKGMVVTFLNDSNNTYAYDYPEASLYQITHQDYEEITTPSGDAYIIPYKLLVSGKTEYLIAKVTLTNNNTYSPDSLKFIIENEEVKTTPLGNNLYKIELTGGYNNVEEYLYAVIPATDSTKNQVAGKAKVYHVDEKEVNITAVSVNGEQVPSDFKALIETVYSPLGITVQFSQPLNISVVDSVWDINNDGKLEYGDINILADYSNEMKKLQKKISSSQLFNSSTYYLIFNSFNTDADELAGYMPLGNQFGYVFTTKINSQFKLTKTINHELGHGVFLMEHSFNTYGDNSENSTGLLMDYGNGQITNKSNWFEIHGKKIKLYQFLDRKENSADILHTIKTKKKNVSEYFCFLTPTGAAVKDFFNDGEVLEIKEAYFLSTGGINSFIASNNKKYIAIYSSSKSSSDKLDAFLGYYDNRITQSSEFGTMYFSIHDYPNLKVSYSLATGEDLIYSFANYGTLNLEQDKYFYHDCWGHIHIPSNKYSSKSKGNQIPSYIIEEEDWKKYNAGFEGDDCNFGQSSSFIYKAIKGNKNLSIQQDNDLNELANYLGEKTKGILTPMFYNHNDNNYSNVGFTLALKQLGKKGILTLADFKNTFKFEIIPKNSRPFRGAGIIFSTVDLWDGIPVDYNIGSTDYSSFSVGLFNTQADVEDRGDELLAYLDYAYANHPNLFYDELTKQNSTYLVFRDFANKLINEPNLVGFDRINKLLYLKSIYQFLGLYEPYTYSYSDLISRKEHLMAGRGTSILDAEEAGSAFPITLSEVYNQHVNKYHSSLFLYFALEQGLLEMALPSVELNNMPSVKLRSYKNFKTQQKFTKASFNSKRVRNKIIERAKNKKNLRKKIKKKTNAKRKYDEMSPADQELFEKDFGSASKAIINKLDENDGALIEIWKANKTNAKRKSIKWLEQVANGVARQNWNGYTKVFKATSDEISDATTRIANHRTTTGNLTGGNYGYIEGVVNGNTLDNKMWRSISMNNAQNEIHIFDAISVQGGSGNAWLRITDSEYRMLNKLADDLGGVKNNSYPNITGEFKIVSENPYCTSCQGIIQQFHDMFPNITLILVDGAK